MDFDQLFRMAFGYHDHFQEMRKMIEEMDRAFGETDKDFFQNRIENIQHIKNFEDSDNVPSYVNVTGNHSHDDDDDDEFRPNNIRDVLLKPQITETRQEPNNKVIKPQDHNDNRFNDCSRLRSLFMKTGDDNLGISDFSNNRDCKDCEKEDPVTASNQFNIMSQIYPQNTINFKSVIRRTKYDIDGTKISSTETREGDKVTLVKEVISRDGERTVTTETYDNGSNHTPYMLDSNPQGPTFENINSESPSANNNNFSSILRNFWKLF